MKMLKNIVETKLFGVCSNIASILNLPIHLVRMFFIYISFIGVFSPIVFYLAFAFFLQFKNYFLFKRYKIMEL